MADHDRSHLSPNDCVVAMRTWSRRYRAAFAVCPEGESAEIAARLGPDGVSALDLAVASVRTWVLLEKALHDIRLTESPTLHPAIGDPSVRTWDSPITEWLSSVLDQIDDVSKSLADTIEAIPSTDWARTATLAGGGSIDALSIAREAVRTGAENLKQIERTLATVS